MDLTNQVTAIFGRKGSGKSTLGEGVWKRSERGVIYDINREYRSSGVVCEGLIELNTFIQRVKSPLWKAVIHPQVANEAEFESFCRYFDVLTTSFAYGHRVTLLVDELSRFVTPTSPAQTWRKLIQLSRHRSLDIIVADQRPHAMPRYVTAQANKIAVFSMREPRDLDYIRDYVGTTFGLDQVNRIPQLGEHQYLLFDLDGQTVEERNSLNPF